MNNRIPRILAMVLMLALIVVCILLAQPVRAVECRLEGKPEPTPWEPDPDDIALIAKTVWGEYRGSDYDQRAAVVWCILNRVEDGRFPDTIKSVVTQQYQFHGYSPDNPLTFAGEVKEILIRWHDGEHGIDPSLLWFNGDGRINHYRDAWEAEDVTLVWP